ncbi:MAG: hypothetical protein AAFX85_20200, partial [Pseudomonadota bacterium]
EAKMLMCQERSTLPSSLWRVQELERRRLARMTILGQPHGASHTAREQVLKAKAPAENEAGAQHGDGHHVALASDARRGLNA